MVERVDKSSRSFEFIRLARQLMRERSLQFSMVVEGRITEKKTITLPKKWDSKKVDFIVGDARALPFPRECFALLPPWNVDQEGSVWWKIRNHRNHFELIHSEFIGATR